MDNELKADAASLAKRIDELSPEKRELIQRLIKEESKANSCFSEIPRRKESESYPLSFAQQRLWFLDQLAPGNPFYNESTALRLSFRLDVAAMENSLNEMVRRHETLRTTFQTVDGKPVQVIAPSSTLTLSIVDLRDLSKSDREPEAQRLAVDEMQRPFDLVQGPLIRTSLLRLGDEDYYLLLTMHHIICDGWSMGVFFSELSMLYNGYSTGRSLPLQELPIQYADFAVWQRNWLKGEKLEKMLSYWKQQLADLPVLQLPVDHTRPAAQTYHGTSYTTVLPLSLSEAFKTLTRQEGVTLFMGLLTVFKILLQRYTGQDDIVVGSPIAGRNRPDVQGLIGFFVNSLVLRTDLSGALSFRTALKRIREVVLGALAHQDLPFEMLVEELQPKRDLSRNPLFQVMFQYYAPPNQTHTAHVPNAPTMQINRATAIFDLAFNIWDSADGFEIHIEYSTEIFVPDSIIRMAKHFETLLEGIVADPEQRISELPLLTKSEQQQLLVEWNDTQAEYPTQVCIHHLIEAKAEQRPEALAVAFEDRQLTYQELNNLANQLAHYLQRLGVGPEVLVGVCLERSLEMVISLLGILKAGGAYVPFDTSYPKDRLTYMAENAQVAVIITDEGLAENFPALDAELVCLKRDCERIAREEKGNPKNRVTPENLAYVIYTSGSTGRPKGVKIEHEGLVNLVCWHLRVYDVTLQDRATQLASAAFDACVWELWPYLAAGASVHIVDDKTRTSPSDLLNWLAANRITLSFLPTPLAEAVLEEPWPADITLRTLLLGGDKLRCIPIKALPCDLVNHYGPTEDTVVSTCTPITPSMDSSSAPPIGRPIANTQVYILDRFLNPVPVGVPGELHVGGAGLARGYLNRPELSAEKLIPNPFSDECGARLYKTGDLGCYLPDGNIEFLGRLDHQVKLRGYRIELGEIEAALKEHSGVQEAVALAREGSNEERQLLAYVIQDPHYKGREDQLSEVEWEAEQLTKWQMAYDETYKEPVPHEDANFNIIGWNSSYTGQPIPADEMREWVAHTVNRILSFRPTRVLEIGCGTGLLLLRIAPHCTKYIGTDFSNAALDYLRQEVRRPGQELSQVTLLERLADDFEGIDEQAFDMVILNSVVQYFPNIDYLMRVLEGAVKAVAPGGIIFIGDVRVLQLMSVFYSSVELYKASDLMTLDQLRQRVYDRMIQENELLVDPFLFLALKEHIPQISHVEIQLKRGAYRNEMTQFRYDAILYLGSQTETVQGPTWLNWQEDGLNVSRLRQLLEETDPELLCIDNVPNARILTELKTLELLDGEEGSKTVGELRKNLGGIKENRLLDHGVDPEALYALSEDLDYSITIGWYGSSFDGCYDIVLRPNMTGQSDRKLSLFSRGSVLCKAWHHYTNNPLQGMFHQKLVPQLRRFLQKKLPEYMVPSAFILLDTLPLTPNGKINRRELRIPDASRDELAGTYVAPCNQVEEMLAEIWSEVFKLDIVGIRDNFFTELGGHSLLATQIVSRIRDTFEVEFPLQYIFQAPTIRELAELIEEILIENIEGLSEDQAHRLLQEEA